MHISTGLCQCGCGQPTKIARQNHTARGDRKGQPRRYLPGHNNRLSPHEYLLDASSGCWIWQRAIDHGYGVMCIGRRKHYAHRVLYERYKGTIPAGYVIDHVCRQTKCVNPDHLEAVSQKVNLQRGEAAKLLKGRFSLDAKRFAKLFPQYSIEQYTHEQWKPVQGFEALYSISSLGRLRRHRAIPKILKPQWSHQYVTYTLHKDGIPYYRYAHTLVAEAFIGPRPPDYQVHHSDGNPVNNLFSNLQYVTANDNQSHTMTLGLRPKGEDNLAAKLSRQQVQHIRLLAETMSQDKLAQLFSVSQSTIMRIVRRETWKHV